MEERNKKGKIKLKREVLNYLVDKKNTLQAELAAVKDYEEEIRKELNKLEDVIPL